MGTLIALCAFAGLAQSDEPRLFRLVLTFSGPVPSTVHVFFSGREVSTTPYGPAPTRSALWHVQDGDDIAVNAYDTRGVRVFETRYVVTGGAVDHAVDVRFRGRPASVQLRGGTPLGTMFAALAPPAPVVDSFGTYPIEEGVSNVLGGIALVDMQHLNTQPLVVHAYTVSAAIAAAEHRPTNNELARPWIDPGAYAFTGSSDRGMEDLKKGDWQANEPTPSVLAELGSPLPDRPPAESITGLRADYVGAGPTNIGAPWTFAQAVDAVQFTDEYAALCRRARLLAPGQWYLLFVDELLGVESATFSLSDGVRLNAGDTSSDESVILPDGTIYRYGIESTESETHRLIVNAKAEKYSGPVDQLCPVGHPDVKTHAKDALDTGQIFVGEEFARAFIGASAP